MNQQTAKSRKSYSPLFLRQPKRNEHKFYDKQRDRKIQGMALKKFQLMGSVHQSVAFSSRNSSMRNVVNSTLFNNSEAESNFSVNNNLQHFEINSTLFPTQNIEKKISKEKSINKSSSLAKISKRIQQKSSGGSFHNQRKTTNLSTEKETPIKLPAIDKNREKTIQDILKKYIDTNFIQSLILFMNKDWEEQQKIFFKEKMFEALRNLITQKTNFVNQLIDDFLSLEADNYEEAERRIVNSLLFRQSSKILKDYDNLFLDILKKIPEDKIVKQQSEIEGLHNKLLEIYDPKFINSNQKMKERAELFMGGYTSQKNNLLASIATKIKPSLDFVIEMQKYLGIYQKQIMKMRNQLHNLQVEKANINKLLNKKVNFTPIEIDYQRLKEMTDDSKQQFFQDLDTNFIKFHKQLHKKSDKVIKRIEQQNEQLYSDLEAEKDKNQKLEQIIYDLKNCIPKKVDIGVQVFLLNSKKNPNTTISNSIAQDFLQNVSTPFTFTEGVSASLINLLSIDKVLYDYEIIRNKYKLNSFSDFMVQWFVIKTGSKKVAQIFAKNFMYSVKQLKNKHKRFHLFSKFCGFTGFRKKNILEDLQYIFFQTHQAWYYLIKVALKYRKKICENPTGYHIFPPLQCEDVFRLPLRKVHDIARQILQEVNIPVPQNIGHQVDRYAINQISKFKQNDEKFQSQHIEQIHMLQYLNFDIIAGFVIEYIAREKCKTVENFLRAVALKQKQIGDVLGYSQFESIYRKFYREKRSKVQLIFSKICLSNQNDILNIQNSEPIIRAIIQDESGLRNIFETEQSLKMLVINEKVGFKSQKKLQNFKSFQNFRERYYFQFYDFYNTTAFLEEIYRIIKNLIKNKLKNIITDQNQLEQIIEEKQPNHMIVGEQEKKEEEKRSEEDSEQESEDQYEDQLEVDKELKKKVKQEKQEKQGKPAVTNIKNDLQSKVDAWNKIVVRIPHFAKRVLTIEQLIVHNMKRKEMIEASEFAWKTLRDILIMVSKE